jgi:hypothetical protein
MSLYQPPEYLAGNAEMFQISVATVAGRRGEYACPARIAHEARLKAGTTRFVNRDERAWITWDDAGKTNFALRDALAALEQGGTREEALAGATTLTHAQRRFALHALDQLAELHHSVEVAVGAEVSFDAYPSAYTRSHWGTVTLFGPEYRSRDEHGDETIEHVRVRIRDVKSGDTDDALDYTATAAMVLASVNPDVVRVRVSEYSAHTGVHETRFDGTPDEARALYSTRGHPVADALSGTTYRPGKQCAGCPFVLACPAMSRQRYALGIDKAVATRSITGTDLAGYEYCPTRYDATRSAYLPLPSTGSGGEGAQLRGIAVHALLADAHEFAEGTERRACTVDDWPDPELDAVGAAGAAEAAGVDPATYAAARPYLLNHVEHCLLGYAGLDEFVVERRFTLYDPDADVVMTAAPDLAFRAGDDEVWRETKTSSRGIPPDTVTALDMFPTFAFDVVLLHALERSRGRVPGGACELEVLGAESSAVWVVPLSDGSLVAHAQRIVAGIARLWAQDLTFGRNVSASCRWCPASRWCDPPESFQPERHVDDGTHLGLPDPF